jgi:hypothetical protein
MAEDQNQAVGSSQIPVPPTQGASQFALAISPAEILMSIGHARVVMTQVPPGTTPAPQPFTEWFLTLAVSPTATVMLLDQLKLAISTYESKFGKIPRDPSAKIDVQERS